VSRFPLRVGVLILPDMPWREARPVWARAEALGFDHAWTYDHLAWRSLRDGPWFGAVPTLTAAAMVTSRLRLGRWSPIPRTGEPFRADPVVFERIFAG
jgi:alkanesulfonate monooxygenase SsuD/methylene tetrahydromethanopterin reductase-like flavin-dependent oxidoreductase (luciferase family)